MSEWSHLANAKHIDLIIAHVKANPAAWYAAWAAAAIGPSAAWDAAWDAAMMTCSAAYNAAWDAVPAVAPWSAWDAVPAVAYDAARVAILALVAWDHAGGLMDLPAEQVNILAILGDQAAILLYPAIEAMETTQELA